MQFRDEWMIKSSMQLTQFNVDQIAETEVKWLNDVRMQEIKIFS
jgi:hypothetical protein